MHLTWTTIRLMLAILVIAFSTTVSASNNHACAAPLSQLEPTTLTHTYQDQSTSCDEHCFNDNSMSCSMMSSCAPCLSPLPTVVATAPFFFHQTLSTELPKSWVSLIVMPELQPPRNQFI